MIENDKQDYLTGLLNRKGMKDAYEDITGHVPVCMMFCDLDNFKAVNDIYGHAIGDKLLVAVATMLREVAPEAVIGRQSGDEFILFLEGKRSRTDLAFVADSIIQGMKDLRSGLQYAAAVSVSIGIAEDGSGKMDFNELLRMSDTAMYQAKQSGKSCYVFFEDLKERVQIESEMELLADEAISKGRFKLFFQPVVNMQSSRLELTELIVRWEKEDGTYWSMEEFRPVFEKNGFIRKVDAYVFEELCKTIPRLRISDGVFVPISVQFSRFFLLQDEFGKWMIDIIRKYGVKPEELEISVREDAFEHRDAELVIRTLNNLKGKGFSVSIINFGDSFSSFRYLRYLPLGSLHFDTNYLRENIKDDQGRQIIKTLIRLGKDLKQMLVADGIESQEAVRFLGGCGCDAASGVYYTDPLEEKDYLAYMKKHRSTQNLDVCYAFRNNLLSTDGSYEGQFVGNEVIFTKGISDNWGGVYFPGGCSGDNLVKLPTQLLARDSYTISFWMKMHTAWTWGSVVFMQYIGGFASVVPVASDGISIFRIYEDEDLNGWHDILCRAAQMNQWVYITVTYDSFGAASYYYINGKRAGYQVKVPIMYSCREFYLGGDDFQKSFNGVVSAFAVCDRAKSEDEIKAMYESFLSEPGFQGERKTDDL